MVEMKCGCLFFWLKSDTWPCSAILDLPFIGRHPRRVLQTSFMADVTAKLTGDEAIGSLVHQTNLQTYSEQGFAGFFDAPSSE